MSVIGIYIETQDGKVKRTARELATLTNQAHCECCGVLFDGDPDAAAEELGPYGMARMLHVTADPAEAYHPERCARQLANLTREHGWSALIGADSPQGKDLFPRTAALLDAPLATDCMSIDFSAHTAVKSVYSGKLLGQLRLNGEVCLYTLRPNVAAPQRNGRAAAQVEAVPAVELSTRSEIRDVVRQVSNAVDLSEAQVIVAGGYGMGKPENFELLKELADTLGGAVGASRRAVDEGLAPYDMQVGQTGKVVNPKLYIACGISGAVQHFAGMKSSKVIVAINKDPNAPIFKKAHYGIVGDLFEVVPQLTKAFKRELAQ